MSTLSRLGPILTRTSSLHTRTFANQKLKDKIHQDYLKSRTRIITVPNVLTFSRIATTPAISYFICNGMQKEAIYCFAFAATTDLLDGLIARVFKQQSDFGAVMDPIADKFLLTTTMISLFYVGIMPIWLVKALVTRDLLILTAGAAIRYNTFDQPPTLRKYFDLKNYPLLGIEPTLVSKIHTALVCGLVVTQLSTHHMVDTPYYNTSIGLFQAAVAITATWSLTQYSLRFGMAWLESRVPKFKGKK